MKRLVWPALCLTLLAACASSGAPPVGPSQVQLEQNRYRVTFRGVSGAPATEIQDRALLHAATLALNQGYDWISVIDRYVDVAAPTEPQFTLGVGGASFGHSSGFGVGASRTFGGQGTYVTTMEVLFGRGPRPAAPNAYDAHELVANLGPRFAPPAPAR